MDASVTGRLRFVRLNSMTGVGAPPSRRYKHTTTVVGSRMWVIGGQESHAVRFGNIFSYDVRRGRWAESVPRGGAPPMFSRHTAVAVPGTSRILTFGGFDGHGTYLQLNAYDTRSREWMPVAASGVAPVNRTNHASLVVEDVMYVFGGITGRELQDLDDFHAIDLRTMTWSPVVAERGRAPEARCGHLMFSAGRRIYVWGGGAKDQWRDKFLELHCFDLDSRTWYKQPTTGEVAPIIFGLSCTVDESFLFCFAGIGPEAAETVNRSLYVLDLVSFHWQKLRYADDTPGVPREKAMGTASFVDNAIFFFGGSDTLVRAVDDFEVLSLPWPSKSRSRSEAANATLDN